MLTKRCRSITLDIIKKPSKLSELAHKYKVSERTIRKDLDSINYFLTQSNFSKITKDSEKNYCLSLEKENTKIIFKLVNNHEAITESYSNKERLLELFYILSNSSTPLKLDYIASILFVSKRSVINDIESLRKTLAPYNITVPGSQEGISLKGNEINIRLALVTLFFENMDKLIISDLTKLIKQKDFITSYKVYWRLFENVDLFHIIEVVESTKNYLSIHLSDYAYLYSIACFSLALKRHKNMNSSTTYNHTNPTTKQIINNLFEHLFKDTKDISEKEKDYIFEILLRLSHDFYLYEVKDSNIKFSQFKSVEFNTKISEFYHIDQVTKDNIKKEIIKIYITNKLNYNEDKNIIELNDDFYKKIYNKVKEIISECQFGFDFNNDNYWQIAWHIINYEQTKHSTKKNVVIVSDKPTSLNEILIKNLNRLFDIEIIGITSLNQLDKYKDFYSIDYYISTLNIPVTNVLKVHPLLSTSEINYLKQYLDTYTNEKSSTNDEIETYSYILDNGKTEDVLKFIDDTVQTQNIIGHSILEILKDNYYKTKAHPLILNNTVIFNLREHEIVKKNCVISLSFKNKNIKFLFLNSQHTYLDYILNFSK